MKLCEYYDPWENIQTINNPSVRVLSLSTPLSPPQVDPRCECYWSSHTSPSISPPLFIFLF